MNEQDRDRLQCIERMFAAPNIVDRALAHMDLSLRAGMLDPDSAEAVLGAEVRMLRAALAAVHRLLEEAELAADVHMQRHGHVAVDALARTLRELGFPVAPAPQARSGRRSNSSAHSLDIKIDR